MHFRHILITGGAGFVGSNLAIQFKQYFTDCQVTALDSLARRGSELNLPRLASAGVRFVHGDVRNREDLASVSRFDLLIDCAAEPSVTSGTNGSPDFVINTNLVGTINSLDAARREAAAFIFVSTSRVYPIEKLNNIAYRESESRFVWTADNGHIGVNEHGISEEFSLDGARSFYGASKLAAELMVKEYAYQWNLPAVINRCGIVAGPWQMGKVDQGVVTLWVARHHFRRPLAYIGFAGSGKQVRDLLHIDDLFELLVRQFDCRHLWDGRSYNIGGGPDVSVSLTELTRLCQEATGQHVAIDSVPQTNNVDVRIYLTDSRKAGADFAWLPRRNACDIVRDINDWICQHQSQLAPILG
jgi:CDP-paratose 2-epimerase